MPRTRKYKGIIYNDYEYLDVFVTIYNRELKSLGIKYVTNHDYSIKFEKETSKVMDPVDLYNIGDSLIIFSDIHISTVKIKGIPIEEKKPVYVKLPNIINLNGPTDSPSIVRELFDVIILDGDNRIILAYDIDRNVFVTMDFTHSYIKILWDWMIDLMKIVKEKGRNITEDDIVKLIIPEVPRLYVSNKGLKYLFGSLMTKKIVLPRIDTITFQTDLGEVEFTLASGTAHLKIKHVDFTFDRVVDSSGNNVIYLKYPFRVKGELHLIYDFAYKELTPKAYITIHPKENIEIYHPNVSYTSDNVCTGNFELEKYSFKEDLIEYLIRQARKVLEALKHPNIGSAYNNELLNYLYDNYEEVVKKETGLTYRLADRYRDTYDDYEEDDDYYDNDYEDDDEW